LQVAVESLAEAWTTDRVERQQRRHLERDDFDALIDAGFLGVAAPEEQGGLWRSVEESTRPVCGTLRTLAAADPSVALVASMHPAVLGYWLATDDARKPAWEKQRRAAFETAANGRQWGTITSEPGSGGDIMRTRTRAVLADGAPTDVPGRGYRLSGDKHFGSGYGMCDYMFTTAVVDGEEDPAAFFLDMRSVRAADGSHRGITVTAEWDGSGMIATQSHAARLEEMPAVRLEWDDRMEVLIANAAPLITSLFTAVVLGVFDAAIAFSRGQLAGRAENMRAFEQVEWSRAELEHWLAVQAFEGALGSIERGDRRAALAAGLRAKTAVAELAEGALQRLTRVIGGGTFSRRSPLASWFEDVRALGFLRPPWGLAFDGLFATSFGDG
jgi:alkylation response protein AidB-like acyl-CoA dehydrogenase